VMLRGLHYQRSEFTTPIELTQDVVLTVGSPF
jgi:hypothetical protein